MRFFASLLLLGIATAARLPVAAASAPPDSTPARTPLPVPRIVIVEDPGAVSLFTPREDKILPLVQRGIQQLTGKANPAAAWASLVSPQDKVGIKVFSAPGPLSGTRTGVVAAVVRGLTEAGVPASNIIIWDKQRADLVRAGFDDLARRLGVRLAGSADAGYDDQVFYESALLGRLIWGDFDFLRETDKIGGRKSYVSKLVTQEMTKIINVTPLINHNFAGVTGHLYSLAMGSVDNSIRFEADPARLAMAVPEIYALHELGDRVVLNITDALLCQYEGEQRPLLHYSATLNQLRFSTDPVALDVLSLQDLDRYRPTKRGPEAKPIKELYVNAALLELGANELNFIRVERP